MSESQSCWRYEKVESISSSAMCRYELWLVVTAAPFSQSFLLARKQYAQEIRSLPRSYCGCRGKFALWWVSQTVSIVVCRIGNQSRPWVPSALDNLLLGLETGFLALLADSSARNPITFKINAFGNNVAAACVIGATLVSERQNGELACGQGEIRLTHSRLAHLRQLSCHRCM